MSTNNASVDTSVRQQLVSIDISDREVFEVLKSLDPDKLLGIDTIDLRALRKCGPLHHLFVTSFRKHTIPLDWHSHVIIPVYTSLGTNP